MYFTSVPLSRPAFDLSMLRIKKILYPTDFSACAQAALAYAIELARRHQAMLHVLHVAPPLGVELVRGTVGALLNEDDFYGNLRAEAHRRIEAALSPYEAANVLPHPFYTHGQAPGEVILGHVEAEQIDLIVMGAHGWRGLRRMLLGSVTQEVVQRSTCPVLTVREDEGRAEAQPGFNRVLAPVDLSMHSINALACAKELAALYGASLDLLHVVDPTVNPAIYQAGLKNRLRVEADVEKEVNEQLAWLAEDVKGPDVDVRYHIATGHPLQEIIEFATSHGSDLIVIASHGMTGQAHFLMGSVTERVVRAVPCPVFITKPFGKSLLAHKKDRALNTAEHEGV